MKVVSKKLFTKETDIVDIQIKDRHCFAIGKSKIIAHNSYLRPRGSFIEGVGVETPGAIKFAELFDKSSEIITAGSGTKSNNKRAKGKIRKGAMLLGFDIWHADVIECITAKQTPGRLTKFNISINCCNEFMDKVLQVEELKQSGASQDEIDLITWDLKFPDTTFSQYKTEWFGDIADWESKGYPVNIYRTVTVDWLWNLIMESTYNRAEPGIQFLDRVNYFNPLNYREKIFTSNPCGELFLAPGNVCNLNSLNLTQMIYEDETGIHVDFEKIKKYTAYAVRFADNVNDYTTAPLPEYEYSLKNKRRIGVGILGWGSLLYMLKIRFASEEANQLRDRIMTTLTHTAVKTSIDLAKEKGMFALCEPEKHVLSPYFDNINLPIELREEMKQFGIRNCALHSVQPTGNTGVTANITSGGLEPVFMPEYIRTVIVSVMPLHLKNKCPKWYEGEFHETEMFKLTKEGDDEILRGVDEYGVTYKIDKNRGLTKEVLCEDYGVRFLKIRGQWDPNADWAVSTTNLTTQNHVNDLIGFAKFLDNSCSKTINISNDYNYEDFKKVYLDAYKSGYVKGVTTYRAGTMASVLSKVDEKSTDNEEIILTDVKMPENSPSSMKTLKAEGKKWYLNVVYYENSKRPFALFAYTNHPERNIQTMGAVERLINLAARKGVPQVHIDKLIEKMKTDNNVDKICRTISLNLRHGVLIRNIVGELNKIDDMSVVSFLFQVKKYLASYIKDGEKVEGAVCSNCSSINIVFAEGCNSCKNCGATKCS